MNRYKKALCTDHQRSKRIPGSTEDLQDLVRERHSDEVQKEIPELKTIKDWIAADLETWEKVLNKKGDETYIITTSEEDTKNRYAKRSKKAPSGKSKLLHYLK